MVGGVGAGLVGHHFLNPRAAPCLVFGVGRGVGHFLLDFLTCGTFPFPYGLRAYHRALLESQARLVIGRAPGAVHAFGFVFRRLSLQAAGRNLMIGKVIVAERALLARLARFAGGLVAFVEFLAGLAKAQGLRARHVATINKGANPTVRMLEKASWLASTPCLMEYDAYFCAGNQKSLPPGAGLRQ